MAGYSMIRKIKRLEETLHSLGMRWGYHGWQSTDEFDNMLAVMPRDDELPVYARDAVLFAGSIDDLDRWVQGVQWAREYDRMLKVSDFDKRDRKEQDVRNKQLIQHIKQEEIEVINQ